MHGMITCQQYIGDKMNKFLKKLFGIDKLEEAANVAFLEKQRAESEAEVARYEAAGAVEAARLSKLSPKELATEQKEPYVTVTDTKVNLENPRNGFFELDWNEYFVLQLKAAGFYGESDEEIVGKWFTELCRGMGNDIGIPDISNRGSGYINTNNLGNGKKEVY